MPDRMIPLATLIPSHGCVIICDEESLMTLPRASTRAVYNKDRIVFTLKKFY